MSVAKGPITLRFPETARFFGGMIQDFDIIYKDMADYTKSFAVDADVPALVDELVLATALPSSDLKALWRRSGAEIVPRKVDGMRLLLLAAIAALEGGT